MPPKFLVAFLLLILSGFASVPAAALPSGLTLFAWQAHPKTPRYVLPVRQGESPSAAAERYLRHLGASKELMTLFPHGVPKFESQSFEASAFEPLSASRFSTQSLIIANREADYDTESKRTLNFARLYAQAEAKSNLETFMLPIAADLGLNAVESADLRALVAKSFSLLTAMGGHDADPALYGQENRHSVNVVPRRDQFEIALIKHYIANSAGFMFGICRGHQMTSIALGYELIQDLPHEAPSDIGHALGHHAITLVNTGFGILKRASSGLMDVMVNTFHHQSVVYKPGGPAVPAAYSPDGIVEGLEFKNGRGLTLQFHPEVMNDTFGRRIMNEVVFMKNRMVRRACRDTFGQAI